jgi:hypothetical protein
MSVFNALGSAVYSKLSGGTALTALLSGGTASVYNVEPPFEAAYDYVVFNTQTGAEGNDTAHRVKEITLQVRAYATSLSRAGSIDAACDALLHRQALSISGWSEIFTPQRTQDIELVEYDESDRPIYTRGGLYDLKIEKQ